MFLDVIGDAIGVTRRMAGFGYPPLDFGYLSRTVCRT